MADDVVPVRLVNCRHKAVFVRVDGERVELPRVPRPVIIDAVDTDPAGGPSEVLQVAAGDGVTALRVSSGQVSGTLGMPDPVDGVLFLVDPEVLLRFPDRNDLVVADTYSATRSLAEGHESCLVSVRRTLAPVEPATVSLEPAQLPADVAGV